MYSNTLSSDSENSDKPTVSAHTPVYLDGSPITWDNNKATLHGTLYEAEQFYTRTGLFKSLIEDGAATIGKYVVCDTVNGVMFVSGMAKSSHTYDFNDPCPPTRRPTRPPASSAFARW